MTKRKKKYFWIQLKADFFRQKEIKKLRKIAGGDTYTIIYLKMLLLAVENDYKLYFEGVEDNFAEELALELDEDSDNVKMTLSFLQRQKLIEIISDDEFLLPQCATMTGCESESAERVRRFRDRKKEEQKALQCNTSVTGSNKNVTIEKDIEKDIEKEKELQLQLEQEKEIKSILENGSSGSSDDFNIFTYMQQRGFITISSAMAQKIQADIEMYSLEEVKQAVDIADDNGKHTYSYVRGILQHRRAGVDERNKNQNEFEKLKEKLANGEEVF